MNAPKSTSPSSCSCAVSITFRTLRLAASGKRQAISRMASLNSLVVRMLLSEEQVSKMSFTVNQGCYYGYVRLRVRVRSLGNSLYDLLVGFTTLYGLKEQT